MIPKKKRKKIERTITSRFSLVVPHPGQGKKRQSTAAGRAVRGEPVFCLNLIWQAKMQHIKRSILTHVRIAPPKWSFVQKANARNQYLRQLCTTLSTSSDDITTRVLTVVKNFDRLDAVKVTETADFRKDLSLDSLDRVELVMAFEQEFSINIPDDQADKLTCCADVAKYVTSTAEKL
ncbi:Acyl carrier protein 3, mitochondrial-like protein [Drosera capensis]